MSYRKLEIWQEARGLVIKIHKMTLQELPSFELYEEGSQIRRSIKSVKSNIVEGYGRKIYQQEFVRFIVYALASCDETVDHLENLFETESLKNRVLYEELHASLNQLGKKLYNFLLALEQSRGNLTARESVAAYGITPATISRFENPEISLSQPESRDPSPATNNLSPMSRDPQPATRN